MIPVCTVVLLVLLPLSHAAPLTCEELLRPSDQLYPHHLEGRRALIGGSMSHAPYLERFKARDSASMYFSRITSETSVPFHRSLSQNNTCVYSSYNISLNGTSFTYDDTDKRNFSTQFVRTSCGDCVLMNINVDSGKRLHFYLFSSRRQLDPEEMEEFRAQVECLNLPPPVVLDPTKELCPEEATRDAADQTEGSTKKH